MSIVVVDRSNNNPPSTAELDAMRADGVAGVILKATEGANFTDPDFARIAPEVHARGMVVGAYAFVHADVSAQAQADLFNRVVGAVGVAVPIRCADAETADGNVQATVDAFCPAAHINLLYSGAAFARADISQPVPGVMWWIASYGSPKPSAPWGTEAGWQYTDASRWGDCSVFTPTAWADLTGSSTPTPTPTEDSFGFLEDLMSLAKSPQDAARAAGRVLWAFYTNEAPDPRTLDIISYVLVTEGAEAGVTAAEDSPLAQKVRATRIAHDNG